MIKNNSGILLTKVGNPPLKRKLVEMAIFPRALVQGQAAINFQRIKHLNPRKIMRILINKKRVNETH